MKQSEDLAIVLWQTHAIDSETMDVVIDDREDPEITVLANALAIELEGKGLDLNINNKRLVIGDAAAKGVVFERKYGSDFVASIKDGRMQEQIAKMASHYAHIYYLLVGDIWNNPSMINPRAVVGAQAMLAVRYGAKFLSVKDNEAYVWAVYTIASKIHDGKVFDGVYIPKLQYDRRPADRFVACLAATGVGEAKARLIAQSCGYNMKSLLEQIDELKSVKGIGEKTAQQVKNVLTNTYL